MERIKRLTVYQKAVLLLMACMVLVFAVIYSVTVSREGFAYQNTILTPSQVSGITVYSGKLQGKQAIFTVSEDNFVTFQYADTVYDPYTVQKDPSAVPDDSNLNDHLTGIELYCGNDLIFRGGVWKAEDFWWIVSEDGQSSEMVDILAGDENGIDPTQPSIATILELMAGPELTHKGSWGIWFCGALICILNTVSVLFADELFRFGLSFRIQNTDQVEPSDWTFAGRFIAWTISPICALAIFLAGLQYF